VNYLSPCVTAPCREFDMPELMTFGKEGVVGRYRQRRPISSYSFIRTRVSTGIRFSGPINVTESTLSNGSGRDIALFALSVTNP
jgi:hypothetical protein